MEERTDGGPLRVLLSDALDRVQLHVDRLSRAHFCEYDFLYNIRNKVRNHSSTTTNSRKANARYHRMHSHLVRRCGRFRREDRLLLALRHPHQVPALHDIVDVLLPASLRRARAFDLQPVHRPWSSATIQRRINGCRQRT